MSTRMRHRVVALVFPGVVTFDLSVAAQIFGHCGKDHTVPVPGFDRVVDPDDELTGSVLRELSSVHDRGRRLPLSSSVG